MEKYFRNIYTVTFSCIHSYIHTDIIPLERHVRPVNTEYRKGSWKSLNQT